MLIVLLNDTQFENFSHLLSKSSPLRQARLWLTHWRRGRKALKYGQSFLNLYLNFSHYTSTCLLFELPSHHVGKGTKGARRSRRDCAAVSGERRGALGRADVSCGILKEEYCASFICMFFCRWTEGESRRVISTRRCSTRLPRKAQRSSWSNTRQRFLCSVSWPKLRDTDADTACLLMRCTDAAWHAPLTSITCPTASSGSATVPWQPQLKGISFGTRIAAAGLTKVVSSGRLVKKRRSRFTL